MSQEFWDEHWRELEEEEIEPEQVFKEVINFLEKNNIDYKVLDLNYEFVIKIKGEVTEASVAGYMDGPEGITIVQGEQKDNMEKLSSQYHSVDNA